MAAESVEIVLNGVDNATPVMDKVTQKLVDNENRYISKLREQLIAQTEGAEAAERFKLAEMGFSQEAINSAMAIKQQIEALKQADQQIEQTGVEMQKTGASFKDTGEASQKVSSVFSKAFGALGLSELQGFTDQMGSLSGQVKELEEAGKKGGDAFKGLAVAGMAVATAVAAFNIGKMIGEWVFETERWKQALKDALDEVNKGEQQVREKLDKQFQLRLQIAQAAGSDDQKAQELKTLQEQIQRDIQFQQDFVRMREQELAAAEAGNYFGMSQGDVDKAKADLENERKKLELLKEQNQEVQDIRNPSAEQEQLAARQAANEKEKQGQSAILDLKKQIAQMEDPQASADQLILDQAANEEQRKELELLIQQRDASQAKADAEKAAYAEFRKAADDARKEYEDRLAKEEDYLNSLKLRNEELTKGKRAAEELKAQQAGISDEVIAQGRELSIQNDLLEAQKQLADEQKKKDEERQKAFAQPTAPLQAMQSRLLSRVSTGGGDRVAKATEKTAELTAEIERLQREQLELQKRRGVTELAIVEG